MGVVLRSLHALSLFCCRQPVPAAETDVCWQEVLCWVVSKGGDMLSTGLAGLAYTCACVWFGCGVQLAGWPSGVSCCTGPGAGGRAMLACFWREGLQPRARCQVVGFLRDRRGSLHRRTVACDCCTAVSLPCTLHVDRCMEGVFWFGCLNSCTATPLVLYSCRHQRVLAALSGMAGWVVVGTTSCTT